MIHELETTPARRVVGRRTRAGFSTAVHYDLSPDRRAFAMPNPFERSASVEVALN